MIKNYKIILLICMFVSIEIIACSENVNLGKRETQILDSSISFKATFELFKVAENELTKLRETNKKEYLLITPLDEAILFYETFSKYAPKLIKNTAFYQKELLNILKDNTIIKNEEFNNDVVRLLYNTSIEEYSIIVDSLFRFYKNKQIDFGTLECSIIQNNQLSLLVRLNCDNSKLRVVLSKIKMNQEFKQQELNKVIEDILNCDNLNSVKEMNKFQPPFFKSSK